MSTTVEDLKTWYDHGVKAKATHMIIVCDTFDWEDFPVYIEPNENFYSKFDNYTNGKNMAKIMEVYDLSLPFNKQKMTGRFAMSLPIK